MIKEVKTSVIGSYPVKIDNYQIMKSYFDQSYFTWNKYILEAVNDMIKAGIDIVSDGQTRDPFVNIFFRKLNGCRIRARPEVIDKVEYITTITIEDQNFVKENIPHNKKLIGLITGPYTLSKSCIDFFYNDEKQLAFDFAIALNNEAITLQDYVDIISIDEPFFSINMPDYSKELINTLIKNVRIPIRLHACGDVSKIVPDLLDIPVDIL
jgi:5-methyltetrahydropteroyltriglutamate--homocysteine methyltransferase